VSSEDIPCALLRDAEGLVITRCWCGRKSSRLHDIELYLRVAPGTARDVADHFGVSLKVAHAHISILRARKRVRIAGTLSTGSRRPSMLYEGV